MKKKFSLKPEDILSDEKFRNQSRKNSGEIAGITLFYVYL
jgi:hypothetical protein